MNPKIRESAPDDPTGGDHESEPVEGKMHRTVEPVLVVVLAVSFYVGLLLG
jgi:hypothetical protein